VIFKDGSYERLNTLLIIPQTEEKH
jgi:hypothetical protein